ncbi:MAG: hypothetical protein ABJB74_16450 [Gemmatimonas sp.]
MTLHHVGIALGAMIFSAPIINGSAPAVPSDATSTNHVAATELVATLSPVGSSRIAGSVSFKPGKDSSQINATIEIRGASLDEQHPWQIRNGRCGESNPAIEGAVAMYRKLSVRADGTANIRQTLTTAMPNPATQSVTVSQSPNDIDVIVACGNLSVNK